MGARGARYLYRLGLAMLFVWPAVARADSLARQLDTLFGESGITLDVRPIDPRFPPHTAHFQSASLQQLGVLTSKLSAEAADFPAISTVPGFTYRYDEKLQVFTPVTESLGPIFVERPETLGQGKFEFGVSYAYVDFKKLNGTDLDQLGFTLAHNDCCGGPNTPDFPAFEDDTITVDLNKFELTSNVVTVAGTSGLTPSLDLNLLLPIVQTSLKVRGVATINDTTNPPIHFFNNETQTIQETRSIDDDHLGVGDLQLRTKYRLESLGVPSAAVGLTFRFPSGSQDDFQGFGEFTLEPFAVVGKDFGPVNAHGSVGFQIDPETLDRTRVRYGGGIAIQAMERIAIVTDVIGSSNIVTEKDTLDVPQFNQQGDVIGFAPTETRLHADIVDVVPGLKVNVFGSAVAFFSVFVPVNESGLRADFIPTGGLEMSF